jgi:aminopeptidase
MEIDAQCAAVGASPLIVVTPEEAMRRYYEVVLDAFLDLVPGHYEALVRESDVVFHIRSERNVKTLANTDPTKVSRRSLAMKGIREERLSKRWCLTQFPTDGYAQLAEMSVAEYEDFVYGAILRDWSDERTKMTRLKGILDQTDEVQILGVKTDLTLSVTGRNAVVGDVTHNVPGGEVFTAPVDDSAEGEIVYEFPAIAYGKEVQGIRLEFKEGEVVDYSAEKNEELLKTMIQTDEGARRLGELGIGTNDGIKRYTKNILFDEKIGGSVHLALGRAYKECEGVNASAIHWDMIKSLTITTEDKLVLDGREMKFRAGHWTFTD